MFAATTHTENRRSETSAGGLSELETRQCFWRDRFLTKLTSVKLKTWPNPYPHTFEAQRANQTKAERWSSSHLNCKHPLLFHCSPYTSHWGHGLWAHNCPTRHWKTERFSSAHLHVTKSSGTCTWPAWQYMPWALLQPQAAWGRYGEGASHVHVKSSTVTRLKQGSQGLILQRIPILGVLTWLREWLFQRCLHFWTVRLVLPSPSAFKKFVKHCYFVLH